MEKHTQTFETGKLQDVDYLEVDDDTKKFEKKLRKGLKKLGMKDAILKINGYPHSVDKISYGSKIGYAVGLDKGEIMKSIGDASFIYRNEEIEELGVKILKKMSTPVSSIDVDRGMGIYVINWWITT